MRIFEGPSSPPHPISVVLGLVGISAASIVCYAGTHF